MDYRSIIEKYFKNNEKAQTIYLTHVTLVTQKSLEIAMSLNLGDESIKFIEEAGMLHDIGCCKVDFKEMNCYGNLPYICHMTEGHKILENEGFPKHARVASTHTGVGIWKEDIEAENLPLEMRDYFAESIEEKIISYADLFFSKNVDRLFEIKTPKQIVEMLKKHNLSEKKIERFKDWHRDFSK